MVRRVFFSFHYERDVWRVGRVRNAWVTQEREVAGYWDSAKWEQIKKQGNTAIEKWIDDNMKGTSVTVVLIGQETYNRKWVKYEINKTIEEKKALFGIFIHNIKNQRGETDNRGSNPFVQMGIKNVVTYDWVHSDGYHNIGNWIDNAYKKNYKKDDGFWSWFK